MVDIGGRIMHGHLVLGTDSLSFAPTNPLSSSLPLGPFSFSIFPSPFIHIDEAAHHMELADYVHVKN
jgi:hypothetical protein